MNELLAFWQSIPAEHRGWVEFWAFSLAVALARSAVRRFVPSASMPGWLHAIDWVAHAATASSKALGDKANQVGHGGIPDWQLPRVSFPGNDETPVERPSKRP